MGDHEEVSAAAAAEAHFEALRRFVDEQSMSVRQSAAATAYGRPARNAHVVPIKLRFGGSSTTGSPDHLNTANAAFNKLAGVLSYLHDRVATLRNHAEQHAYPMLLMFGEGAAAAPDPAAALAAALPALRDAAQMADAVGSVTLNLMCQLGGMCAQHTRKATILQGEDVHSAVEAAAEGLGVLLRLECLVQRATGLAPAFAAFRRLLNAATEDAQLWSDTSPEEAEAVAAEVAALETLYIPQHGFFRHFLDSRLASPTVAELFSGGAATTILPHTCRELLKEVLGRWGAGSELAGDWETLTDLTALSVAHAWLVTGPADRKLLRDLQELHTQVPLLHVFSDATIPPTTLLARLLPRPSAVALPLDLLQAAHFARVQAMDNMAEDAPAATRRFSLAAMAWAADLDAALSPQRSDCATLQQGIEVVTRGLRLAVAMRRWAHAPAALATHLQLPLPPGLLVHVARAACLLKMQLPLPPWRLVHLAHAACLLKGVEASFNRQSPAIAAALPHMLSHARAALAAQAAKAQKSAVASGHGEPSSALSAFLPGARKKRAEALTDVRLVVSLITQLAAGAIDKQELVLLRLCIDALRATGCLTTSQLTRLSAAVQTVGELVNIQTSMRQACGCEWLFFLRNSAQPALQSAVREPNGTFQLPHLLAAFADGAVLLPHASPTEGQAQAYEELLYGALELAALQPAVAAIETDLRLQLFVAADATAAGTPGGDAASQAAAEAATDAAWVLPLCQLPTLRLISSTLSIRQWLGDRLAARLYENAAVAPQDVARLTQMAALAADKYSLAAVPPPRLPGCAASGGLDVLEVVGGLDVFAACFAYCAATHSFVQRPAAVPSGAAYLSVLTVDAFAEAVRAHGLGLLPAAVNAAYQFLRRKTHALSQVLFEEGVRGRLLTEARWWAAQREGLGSLYPSQRAARLAADMAALQAPPEGSDAPPGPSPLHTMRLLVTEMGNALGFVRLARQAGMRVATALSHTAEPAARRCPGPGEPSGGAAAEGDHEAGKGLADLAEADSLKGAIGGLAETVDDLLADLQARAIEGLDFFPSLILVFAKELCTPANRHLRAFHVAVPALAAQAVEASLVAKEALARRRRGTLNPAGFTDDGFPLGLAYLLKVLEQETAFDSLQWFHAVGRHYRAEAAAVVERSAQGGAAASAGLATRLLDGLSAALRGGSTAAPSGAQAEVADVAPPTPAPADEENRQLLLSRIRNYAAEYELLANTLAGVRMFFAETDE